MTRSIAIAVVIAVSAPLGRAASANCPWFTQGSAAVLLGGEVVSTINAGQTDFGTCHFSRKEGNATFSLDIMVQEKLPSACRNGSEKLVGIGTAASGCTVEHSSASLVEQVDGQVRDVRFVAIMSMRDVKLSEPQQEAQRKLFHQAAEQIAGNLF